MGECSSLADRVLPLGYFLPHCHFRYLQILVYTVCRSPLVALPLRLGVFSE